uniref:Neurotransmitter-gated ion-channel ligand binding domain protein n=1 Tax=Megaviridae environmental sample TaxID=1737588 RepID=A0A5J6VL22_9VIRU|nr:MAG: neurotransmitter-gated ion-channel ligand binding domain protein [Megaviridae environmental sample]
MKILFFIFISFCKGDLVNLSNTSNLNSLKYSLLLKYDRDNIPKQTEPLDLSLQLELDSINDVSQLEGTVSYNIWLNYNWYDYQLKWDKQYYNIDKLTFNTEPNYETSIWIPDIELINHANFGFNLKYTRANVYSNGSISWLRPGTLKAICNFDLSKYPYDKQECFLKFKSIAYSKTDINLFTKNIILDYYKDNSEWELTNTDSYIYNSNFNNEIYYKFYLTRISSYYNINIIFPLFILGFLNIITVFIPINEGDRISFSITLLLSIIVFLSLVSDSIPKSRQVPFLSKLVISFIVYSFFSIIGIIFICRLNNYIKYFSDLETNQIDNKVVKYIYIFFGKLQLINNIEENDNVNNNLKKILKWSEVIYTILSILYFIIIILFLFIE